MSSALRNHLLLSLEGAAKHEIAAIKAKSPINFAYIVCDASASVWGVSTSRLCYLTGWSRDRIDYHLRIMAEEGLILKHQYHAGAPIRWWPVGLFKKMEREVNGKR
jgi:hypothetical protein